MNYTYSPAQVASEAFSAWADCEQFEHIEKMRPLTNRERAEQSIAAIKLIIFSPILLGLALDRIFGNH